MKITFEKANKSHESIIFKWLDEPHMKEFWDNSEAHRQDIRNFIHGKPRDYFKGIHTYWIGFVDGTPFSFILTSPVHDSDDVPSIWKEHLSETGATYSIDFGIGSTQHLGQGLGAPTLMAFTQYIQKEVDPKADTFFIDPDENNPRAIHVYAKAGFKHVGSYVAE